MNRHYHTSMIDKASININFKQLFFLLTGIFYFATGNSAGVIPFWGKRGERGQD